MDYDESWSAGELWSNLFAHRLWLWLVIHAEKVTKTFEISGRKIQVMPGELITSYNVMAEGISWLSRGVKKQPTVKQIQGLITNLVDLKMLEIIYDVDDPKKQRWLHLKLLQYSTKAPNSYSSKDRFDSTLNNSDMSVIYSAPGELARQASVAAKTVFSYWVEVMGKSPNTKLTDERKNAILERLKNYDVKDIKDAIDGCRASSWHMGQNAERQLHNDIELICRDDTHLEKFMEMSPTVIAAENKRRKQYQEREDRIARFVMMVKHAWVGQDYEQEAKMYLKDDEIEEVKRRLGEKE